jgi:putative peptidoglycan lipid II flippase
MNLLRTASAVSAITLLSRVTGLLRETLKAAVFGAGVQMDAFEAAFRLPNLLRRLFAEGAFAQAFVPILTEYRERKGQEATRALLDRIAGALVLVLLGVTILGVIGAPLLVYLLAGGFAATPGKVELTAELIRICFPYLLFVSLVSLAGGILNVHRKFAVPAFAPVLLNLAIIGAALLLAPHFDPPVLALGWGVFAGGLAQLALQVPALRRIGMLPRPRIDWADEGVRRVLRGMVPALVGVSAAQINILIATQLAALLGDGRISWISYADRLMEFPTALLGVAIGTVLLPSLSRQHANADTGRYSDLLDWGLRLVVILALPATAALAVLSVPLVATLYQYGRFGIGDVMQVRVALLGYCVGLIALIAIKVLAPGFYARQDLRTPVRYSLVAIVLTQAIAVSLMYVIGHAALTLATSIGACANAALLLAALRRQAVYKPAPGWGRFLLKTGIAVAAMSGVLWLAGGSAADWTGAGGWARVGRLGLVVALGAAAYFGTLRLLGFRLADFARREV